MSRAEFDRIARFEAKMAQTVQPDSPVWLTSGDDAAVLRPTGDVVVCTDTLVEGQHFLQPFARPYNVGHKALSVNVSDLAAMGAKPTAAVIALAINHDAWDEAALDELYDGLCDAAKTYGVVLAGGDTVTAEVFSITVTAIGIAEQPVVTRTNARVGDVLVLVGYVGSAAGGLLALMNEVPAISPVLRLAHVQPTAQVAAGMLLCEMGATSMIDISDGLGADLMHIGVGSHVSIGLRAPLLQPFIHPDLLALLAELPADMKTDGVLQGEQITSDVLLRVLCGGEDFALAATMDLQAAQAFVEVFGAQHPDVPAGIVGVVGEVEEDVAVTLFEYGSQDAIAIGDLGWDHG